MPRAVIHLTEPVSADRKRDVLCDAGAPPRVSDLLGQWHRYVVLSGNSSRVRKVVSAYERYDLPVEVYVGDDVAGHLASKALIPNDFRDSVKGYCVTRIGAEIALAGLACEGPEALGPDQHAIAFKAGDINGKVRVEGTCNRPGGKRAAADLGAKYGLYALDGFDRVTGDRVGTTECPA